MGDGGFFPDTLFGFFWGFDGARVQYWRITLVELMQPVKKTRELTLAAFSIDSLPSHSLKRGKREVKVKWKKR